MVGRKPRSKIVNGQAVSASWQQQRKKSVFRDEGYVVRILYSRERIEGGVVAEQVELTAHLTDDPAQRRIIRCVRAENHIFCVTESDQETRLFQEGGYEITLACSLMEKLRQKL